MAREFDHINDARGFIVDKLSDDALLGRNGYMMRSRLYILDYDPRQQSYAADLIRAICSDDLPSRGVTPLDINLYDIVLRYLDEQGLWDALVEAEAVTPREDLIEMLQDTVSISEVVAPAVNEAIASTEGIDIVFITGSERPIPTSGRTRCWRR